MKNPAEAIQWYRRSAAQGVSHAQYNLGAMYATGQGVALDYTRAYMWMAVSTDSGQAAALSSREIIARQMTQQQLAQAQKMARDCQASQFKACE